MFVVTTIFLVGLIFVVQQLLFQYMSVDPKAGFEFNEYGIVKSLAAAANATLQGSSNCAALENDMEVLKNFIESRTITAGYFVDFNHNVNCSAFDYRVTLPSWETQATISLETNKNAECRYSDVSGAPYSLMTPFQSTGGTSHSTVVSGLQPGQEYTYYVRCRDNELQINDEYSINFFVAGA